jgi:hypothetical protein
MEGGEALAEFEFKESGTRTLGTRLQRDAFSAVMASQVRVVEDRSGDNPPLPRHAPLGVTRFATSLRTDNSPQPKEARPLSHALTSD